MTFAALIFFLLDSGGIGIIEKGLPTWLGWELVFGVVMYGSGFIV